MFSSLNKNPTPIKRMLDFFVLFENNHGALRNSGNEFHKLDSCALPDFTNCLLRSQFAKSCKCSESKRLVPLSIGNELRKGNPFRLSQLSLPALRCRLRK